MGILDKIKSFLSSKEESKKESREEAFTKSMKAYEKEVAEVNLGKKLTDAQKWENMMHVRRKNTLIARRRSGSFVVAFPDGEFFQCSKQLAMTYTLNPFKLHK